MLPITNHDYVEKKYSIIHLSITKKGSSMKYLSGLILIITCLMMHTSGTAQVTNPTINGVSSNFTMTSGDPIRWHYDIPVGSTTTVEIWFDANGNAAINPGTDVALFLFTQTDGDTNGNGGPPDQDGLQNGQISAPKRSVSHRASIFFDSQIIRQALPRPERLLRSHLRHTLFPGM